MLIVKAGIDLICSKILRKIRRTVHIMHLYKILLKKSYCSGLVEGVDLIFRIVCQISGQDKVTHKQWRTQDFRKGEGGGRRVARNLEREIKTRWER